MLIILFLVFGGLFTLVMVLSFKSLFRDSHISLKRNSILHLQLKGVIMDGKKLLAPLIKYREDKSIQAIVIEINSPGGVVGPSQEIYEEIKRTREEFKKPIVAVSTGVMASGAYYSAVAADKIIVAPGVMMGSIGVIMEFMNLEKLYEWAKVSRFTITTGKYKDSGAEYRSMREDERQLFQDLINDVYEQFVEAVSEGRDLKTEEVKKYADGRVFTGRQGVDLGFADELGTLEDGYRLAADLAGLGDDYEVFEPAQPRPGLIDLIMGSDDDEASTKFGSKLGLFENQVGGTAINEALRSVLRVELANKPLFLMPGVY